MSFPDRVKVVEVGLRDGLQNEKAVVPTGAKVEFIKQLTKAGVRSIEAGSFVSPKWVPQMANTADVLALLGEMEGMEGVNFPVLVPNMKGLELAMSAGAREIAIFGAVSETFSQKNLNCSMTESMERFQAVCDAALAAGIRVRGYTSCVLGCPYEGEVDPAKVVDMAEQMLAMGCYEISLGDTIGVGTPSAARALVEQVANRVGMEKLAVHFHDTYGQALANIFACLEVGISVVDSSVSGLGGCPYARGASGNVATEDVLYMLEGLEITTGIDLKATLKAGVAISNFLQRVPASKVSLARGAV